MRKVVIVGGVRTPIGSHGGAFRTLTAQHLAALVFEEVIKRTGIDAKLIDDVILGCIGQQSDAPNIGRVAALMAGVPVNVPGYTVQRNCVSSMQSITAACQAIQAICEINRVRFADNDEGGDGDVQVIVHIPTAGNVDAWDEDFRDIQQVFKHPGRA